MGLYAAEKKGSFTNAQDDGVRLRMTDVAQDEGVRLKLKSSLNVKQKDEAKNDLPLDQCPNRLGRK